MTARDDGGAGRRSPSRLPDEGPCVGMRCPQCGGERVDCVSAMFEFSELVCRRCEHTELVDDWQIAGWCAPGG